MKVIYKSGKTYIVKIDSNKVYYGNGKNVNGFGESALQFLRFNPYMDYVENENLPIPDTIRQYIEENHKNNEDT